MVHECYCTKNDCYKENEKLASVSWLIVHSPAVYPTIIRARSGSGGGWYNRWNKSGVEKLVHGFIDDTGIYNFAPYDMACWQIGDSWGNKNCVGYELCELESNDEFQKMWDNATSHYADLCKKFGLDSSRVIGHYEAHKKGFASNHSDPEPYFSRFGRTMSDFRADVKKKMTGTAETIKMKVKKTYDPWAYATVVNLTKGDPYLNVRSGPGVDYSVVRQLAFGNEVDVIEDYENGWSKINITGTVGYVNSHYLKIGVKNTTKPNSQTTNKTMVVSGCSSLYVRKTPNGAILDTIHAGDVVTLIGSGKDSDGDEWSQIQKGKLIGYVWPKYLQKKNYDEYSIWTGEVYNLGGSRLNVRTGPGTNYGLLSEYSKLAETNRVDVIGESGDWYQVRIAGKHVGWVNKAYIKRV